MKQLLLLLIISIFTSCIDTTSEQLWDKRDVIKLLPGAISSNGLYSVVFTEIRYQHVMGTLIDTIVVDTFAFDYLTREEFKEEFGKYPDRYPIKQ